MKALSLTRPWTWLVLHGGKDIENRTWAPKTTPGFVVVHGAQSIDMQAVVPYLYLLDDIQAEHWARALDDKSTGATGLLGVVEVTSICTRQLDGSWSCDCGPWAMPGQAHWHLANPLPFCSPVMARGSLGLWRLSPDLEREVNLRVRNAA